MPIRCRCRHAAYAAVAADYYAPPVTLTRRDVAERCCRFTLSAKQAIAWHTHVIRHTQRHVYFRYDFRQMPPPMFFAADAFFSDARYFRCRFDEAFRERAVTYTTYTAHSEYANSQVIQFCRVSGSGCMALMLDAITMLPPPLPVTRMLVCRPRTGRSRWRISSRVAVDTLMLMPVYSAPLLPP